MPDTVSEESSNNSRVNKFNKDMADYNKTQHENKLNFNKECLESSDYVTSESGQISRDISIKDIELMSKNVNESENHAQYIYDAYHDEINHAYAVVKESINVYRNMEIRALTETCRVNKNINIDAEKSEILAKYDELEKNNFTENGMLKGELRSCIYIRDVNLRGLDETDQDSVSIYEAGLNHEKRKVQDSNDNVEEGSSRKRFKQDSSDIEAEYDPFDPFSDE